MREIINNVLVLFKRFEISEVKHFAFVVHTLGKGEGF